MFSNDDRRRIESFVSQEPRSMQELAQFLGRNWRTAARYVEQIKAEYGTLEVKTFRKGTQGALKIVYWAGIERASATASQQMLEARIRSGRTKNDFSPFDIYQFADAQVIFHRNESADLAEFSAELANAREQVLFYSGNLSLLNSGLYDAFESILERGVNVKVLCRVDVESEATIREALSLSRRFADRLEIRHCEHPLRAAIIDDRIMRLKEQRIGSGKTNELGGEYFLFYRFEDREWIVWLTRLFWNLYASSVGAPVRLERLERIRRSVEH
ncbi:MAG: hypothetical protein ACMXYM_01325 [Candidatus Woesearchaeota archaeon]